MGYKLELEILNALHSSNISKELQDTLFDLAVKSDNENQFSKPMPWIGMYIALASLFCILAMVADLLHGLRNKKLWFPCKYFTVNAASLTVIAIVVKLPMDLNNSMPGDGDQVAKLGSIAFMCIMMANLLPSLAIMDSNQLLTNMIALSVLVITLFVNVCIQISTGVVSYHHKNTASASLVMLLMLLMIYICSSLAILRSKEILELKYEAAHEAALKDQQPGRLSVEMLNQHVRNYWIMAGTGSPQFMIACSATTSASGVICALATFMHIINIFQVSIGSRQSYDYQSDYRWSMSPIVIIQFIGVIMGTIAPLFRCFAILRLKLSINWIWNHLKIFKVEGYWTQKFFDWKHSSIPFSFQSHKSKIIIENSKVLILSICIGFQRTIVVTCKIITLNLYFFMICIWCCSHCWMWLKTTSVASGIMFIKDPAQFEGNNDLSLYVLQLQDDVEFAERTLKSISKSMNCLIKKAEKNQPNSLMKLLAESTGFDGVGKYDSHHVPPLLSEEYLDCWSLPLVTLTTIAISLPNIESNIVDWLLSSVSEGLAYVTLVEESLNATDDYKSIQKSAKMLWLEVELYHKWLGHKLRKNAQVNTTEQILQWFRDTAKNMVIELDSTHIGDRTDNSICISISAMSMYRITETILMSYDADIDQISQEQLFSQLSSMIADILAACLTNLPQLIAMKCHASAIEKREASVHAAALLLGETMQIINNLQDRELPSLNPDERAFIEKWRAYLMHPFL